jgi:hypothetical protein
MLKRNKRVNRGPTPRDRRKEMKMNIETKDIKAALMEMRIGPAAINGIPVERRSTNKWTVSRWRVRCTGIAKAARVLDAWLEPPHGVFLHAGEIRYE